jgi:hypothetical protein
MIVNLISDVKISANLALQKVKKFYSSQGHKITQSDRQLAGQPDVLTYISVLFTKNAHEYRELSTRPDVVIGGSGWDLSVLLPPEIEAVQPRVNYGFASRGCNRDCYFCLVQAKEGPFRVVGDIYDIWNGKPGVTIKCYDNNILFDPAHFDLICQQVRKENLKLDFNQGLDWRLFTQDTVKSLTGVKSPNKWRFALDFPAMIPKFAETLELIKRVERTPFVYVFADGDWNGTMERLEFLRLNGCKAYLMCDEKIKLIEDNEVKRDWVILAEWCNNPRGHFFSHTWEQFKIANLHRKTQPRRSTVTAIPKVNVKQISIDDITEREDLKDFLPPIDAVADEKLQADIKDHGIREPLVLAKFDNQTVLLDGHNRLRIARSLDYTEVPAVFRKVAGLIEAQQYMLQNQLGKRNLGTVERILMVLKLEPELAAEANRRKRMTIEEREAEKILKSNSFPYQNTIKRLASISKTSTDKIWKMKKIIATGNQELLALTGSKISINEAAKIADAPQEERQSKLNQAIGFGKSGNGLVAVEGPKGQQEARFNESTGKVYKLGKSYAQFALNGEGEPDTQNFIIGDEFFQGVLLRVSIKDNVSKLIESAGFFANLSNNDNKPIDLEVALTDLKVLYDHFLTAKTLLAYTDTVNGTLAKVKKMLNKQSGSAKGNAKSTKDGEAPPTGKPKKAGVVVAPVPAEVPAVATAPVPAPAAATAPLPTAAPAPATEEFVQAAINALTDEEQAHIQGLSPERYDIYSKLINVCAFKSSTANDAASAIRILMSHHAERAAETAARQAR